MRKERILVIGANGQIGSVLTNSLMRLYGQENVVASDIHKLDHQEGYFELLDVLDIERLGEVIDKYEINQIYHLAAILSAKGEAMPMKAWNFNMTSFFNVVELSIAKGIQKVFFPSSIAAFGPTTPRINTPQETVMIPETVYGISKSCAEDWCNYIWHKNKLDIRSIRYPGIIGYQSMPGGGTTDYAVDIYHKAVKGESFECFLKPDTMLPMIYMEDAIRATIQLMEAPLEKVKVRTSYNLAAMSFTPSDITESIRKFYPLFEVTYNPDFRQAIAESWPASIDDSVARNDWDWKPKYDLENMTKDMIHNLQLIYKIEPITV